MKCVCSGLFLILIQFGTFLYGQPCDDTELTSQVKTTIPDCNRTDGSIVLSRPSGGVPPYTYQLGSSVTQTGAFFDLGVGVYPIVLNDALGCRDTMVVDLTYRELSSIIKPYNTFTPNGDNMNDRWVIPGIESFQSSVVNVFNRWGQQVHLNSPYVNEKGWDGTQNGSDLPEGTYYYVITVFNNCQEESLAGTVNIIR